jgi:hypothetical protein
VHGVGIPNEVFSNAIAADRSVPDRTHASFDAKIIRRCDVVFGTSREVKVHHDARHESTVRQLGCKRST